MYSAALFFCAARFQRPQPASLASVSVFPTCSYHLSKHSLTFRHDWRHFSFTLLSLEIERVKRKPVSPNVKTTFQQSLVFEIISVKNHPTDIRTAVLMMEQCPSNHGACLECSRLSGWCLAAPQLAFGEGQPQAVPTPLCALRNLQMILMKTRAAAATSF